MRDKKVMVEKANTSADTASDNTVESMATNGDGLSQDQFAALLKKLGVDDLDGMLEKAGLADDLEDLTLSGKADDVAEKAEKDDAFEASAPDEDAAAVSTDEAFEAAAPDADAAAVSTVEAFEAAAPENVAAEAVSDAGTTPDDEGLTPEKIARLLEVLGDDAINGMLEDAGLAETAEEPVEAVADEGAEAPASDGEEATPDDEAGPSPGSKEATPDDEAGPSPGSKEATPDEAAADEGAEAPASDGEEKKPRRRGKARKRILFAAVIIGIALLGVALYQVYMSATLNSDDPIQYSTNTDDITCDEGLLQVNGVTVKVPTDGTEEYSISYSWSEDDEQYPSVPHSISAIYSDKEGNKLYSITLYRNDTLASREVTQGRSAANWFDSWKEDDSGTVRQERRRSGKLDGFYIYPAPAEEDEEQLYNDYCYYFAVEETAGISTYVIEGICLDPEYAAGFPHIMDDCINSISVTSAKETA